MVEKQDKESGSILILVLLILSVAMTLGLSVLSLSGYSINTAYSSLYKSQAKKASDYAIQSYLKSTEAAVIDGTVLPLSGTMGDNSKYTVKWKTTEDATKYTVANITNNISLYSMYPLGSESFSKIATITGTSIDGLAVNGSYSSSIQTSDFSVVYHDQVSNQYSRQAVVLNTPSTVQALPLPTPTFTYFGSCSYWNSNISTLQENYVLAKNDPILNQTDINIYQSNPEIDPSAKPILTSSVSGQSKDMSVTGVYSQTIGEGITYITLVSNDGTQVQVYEYYDDSSTLISLGSETVNYKAISTSAVWDDVLNLAELYIGVLDTSNAFNMYQMDDHTSKILPYSASIITNTASSNFTIGASYDHSINSTIIYLLEESAPRSKTYSMYRYLPDSASDWQMRGSYSLDYPGKVILQGVFSPNFEYTLANAAYSISYETSDITATGYVYQKEMGREILVAQVETKCHIDITYKTDINGNITVSNLNISNVTVK